MKIGIFGDCNSIWVVTYVKEVLLRINNCKVYIFSDKQLDISGYDNLDNVYIIPCGGSKFLKNSRLAVITYIFDVTRNVIKEKEFDYFHIHYVNNRRLFVTRLLKKYTKKTIVTFWGSDLLRIDKGELKKYTKYLSCIHAITVGSKHMMKYLESVYDKDIVNKTMVLRFGVNGIDAIHNFQLSKNEAKKNMKFPINKTIVCIGYNGSFGQNHIKVIKELSNLNKELKKKVFIVIPMTYGLEEDYYSKVRKEIENTGFDYMFLLDYMNANTIANLCFATNIFIHAQETDAFSASVQEFIGAGALVFNPQWIRYEELDSNNAYYVKYDSFKDLKNKVADYLLGNTYLVNEKKLNNNKEIMYRLSSWNALSTKWLKLYENASGC